VTATTEELSPSTPAPPGEARRSRLIGRVRAWRNWAPEAAVVVGALVLFSWGLSKNGPGNTYYAAAVRSMNISWKNFFYGAFDPGGWITVDKPPLAVWLQAGTVKVFGFSSWSLLLPSVVSGAGAVWLLMLTVRRPWGRMAGLTAGIALALTPMVLAVSRSNNPDATLLLCMVGAAYATQRAISERKPVWMAVAGLLCGVAFLAKLLVACVMMPGLWLAYFVTGPHDWKRRLRDLAIATGLFVLVAAAWVASFDLVSPSSRPFVGGSTDGTAWDLVFGYNGFGRITGASAGPGGTAIFGNLAGGNGIDQFGGTTGIARLFNNGMGDQVMWLAVFSAVAMAVGVVLVIRRKGMAGERGSIIIWTLWAVVTYFLFAYARGIYHNYYVATLAPAIAAFCGIGLELVRRYKRSGYFVAATALGSAGLALVLLNRVDAYEWLRIVIPVLLGVVALIALVVGVRGNVGPVRAVHVGAAALAIALVPSAIWAVSGVRHAQSGVFPDARPVAAGGLLGSFGVPGATDAGGPGGAAGGAGGFPGIGGTLGNPELEWLESQRHHEKWILAVQSALEAAPPIINGYSVMAMGGFTGSDPSMTRTRLSDLVQRGDLRFVSGGIGFGGFPGAATTGVDIGELVAQVCTAVPATNWGGTGTSAVYDCKGNAKELRTAKVAASSTPTIPGGGAFPGGGAPGGFPMIDAATLEKVAKCFSKHGVTLTGGIPDFMSTKFQKAIQACSSLLPESLRNLPIPGAPGGNQNGGPPTAP
jgi:4-amino-4-deoxy-L-arabinose transferase-like glycosyltransferase